MRHSTSEGCQRLLPVRGITAVHITASGHRTEVIFGRPLSGPLALAVTAAATGRSRHLTLIFHGHDILPEFFCYKFFNTRLADVTFKTHK